MQRLGNYENVSIKKQDTVFFTVGGSTHEALFADCEITDRGLDRGSFVFLTGYKNKMLKIRYTFPKELQDQALRTWDCMMTSFVDSSAGP